MELLYSILDTLLPFKWASYTFMKNALLATLIIAPAFALIGTMVVNNRMSFFSDALGHSALTGIAIGVLLGMQNPLLASIGFGIIFALAISEVKGVGTSSVDTIISVFSSAAMALGIALLSQSGNFSKYSNLLIGDLLSITPSELLTLFIVLTIITIIWCFLYNSLILISLDRSLAKSRGVKVRLVENLFIVLVAVLVTVSINRVGLLIINSMLILPAATARNLAKSSSGYQFMAVIISVFSGVFGLISSFYMNTTAGASIILAMAILFFISLAYEIIMKATGK